MPVKGSAAAWQGVDMEADTMLPRMGAAPTFTCSAGEYSFEIVASASVNTGWTRSSGSSPSIEIYG